MNGLLRGQMKLTNEFHGDDVRKINSKFQPHRYAQYLKALERLDRFAQENYGKRVLEFAIIRTGCALGSTPSRAASTASNCHSVYGVS
jgi:hypothetical protein